MPELDFDQLRQQMVREQLAGRDILDPRVLAVMGEVPRQRFIPIESWPQAYSDAPLPIGAEQTISQPYIVALMTQMLRLTGDESVLEVGTGSGYQTAILSRLARQVYSLEIKGALAARAVGTLAELGYNNVEIRVGDGSAGWPEHAPFDAVVITAAAPFVPQPLIAQVRAGGQIVAPVGDRERQWLEHWRNRGAWHIERLTPVMFVPLLGQHGQPDGERWWE